MPKIASAAIVATATPTTAAIKPSSSIRSP